MAMLTEYYYEYEDVNNPNLKSHRYMTISFQHKGKPRDPVENDFIRFIIQNMKEDEKQGWPIVQKVKVNVWLAKDKQKTGDTIFNFKFKPDNHGYNDLK